MQIYMLLLLLRKSLHLPVVKEPVKVVLPIFSVVSIKLVLVAITFSAGHDVVCINHMLIARLRMFITFAL